MKFIAPLLALVAAVFAQNNAINIPLGGFQVTAGQPLTITWSDPSSGTVTIKLQQGSAVTPDSGITLLTAVPAADKTATFTIDPTTVNTSQYTIEIIDDTDPSNYNFSTNFSIAGASCVGTCDGAASTTSGSVSSTGTATSTGTGSSTATNSSAASASSASASSASASASSSSHSASSASKSSGSASSATAATTTSAPSAGGAGAVKAQAGLVVALAVAVAAF